MKLDSLLAKRFIMGWFDRLDLRISYMTAYDVAIGTNRKTVTERTIAENYWGML